MAKKLIFTDLDLGGNRIYNAEIDLATSSELKQKLDEITVEAGDNTVEVTPGSTDEGTTTATQVKVKVKTGSNDLKVDANGMYVTPYTADGTTIEKTNNQFSVKSGVFDEAGAASAAQQAAAADATQKANAAETAAKSYADTKAAASQTAAEATAAADATQKANQALSDAKDYSDDNLDAAKAYADAITVNGNAQSNQNISLDGSDVDLSQNYAKAAASAAINPGDSVDVAVGKLEKKIDDAVAGGVQSVGAGNGIEVDTTDTNNPSVAVKLDSTDNVLTVGSNGLKANVSMNYDSVAKKIYLKGKTVSDAAVVISEIDCTSFLVDGMLDNVELDTTHEAGKTFLHFEFNTASGKQDIWVDVTSLIDVYTAGNGINITGKVISVKVVAANGLSVDATNGIELALASADGAGAMSAADFTKLAGIEAGAEVNEIDSISVNGQAATITNKAASVTINGSQIKVGGTGTHKDNNIDVAIEGAFTAAADAAQDAADAAQAASDAQDTADGKITKLGTGNASEVLLSTATGEASRSGKTIGGQALDANPSADVLATEKAVADAIAAAAGSGVHSYIATATSGNSASITKTTHQCGDFPVVQCYWDGQMVECAVAVSSGNITVSWNGSSVTAAKPLTIKILG